MPLNLKKAKFSIYSNLTLLSFLMLLAIFFSSKYSLLFSIFLTSFWLLFLISSTINYRMRLLIVLFAVAIISFYGRRFWFSDNVPVEINNKQFTIVSISNNYVILGHKHWKILWWTTDRTLCVDQRIKVISSSLTKIKKANNSYNFDFSSFLKTKYVFYQFDRIAWSPIHESITPRFYFFQWINQSGLHNLIKTFLWQQPLLPELSKKITTLDLGYLLMLKSLSFSIIDKLWGKFQDRLPSNCLRQISVSLYLAFWISYLYLLSFNLIILRFLVRFILKLLKSGVSLGQQRLLTLIILTWFEPTYFLRLTSWFLIIPYLFWPLKRFDSWYKSFFFGFVLFIPLQLMLNLRLNLTLPITLLILRPIFGATHSLLILLWWCPGLHYFWNFTLELLETLISITTAISCFWNIGHVPIIFFMVYFLLLHRFIATGKSLKLLSLIMFDSLVILFWNKIILGNENIFMLNVGNGNSFVYINKLKNLVVIFDCGAGPGRTSSSMADFLKWHGINHVDYLFISHAHQDHYNGLQAVKNTVFVKNIITNETEILQWNFKGFTILGWQLKGMSDPNDSSLVLLFKTDHANLLFMGDMTKVGEEKLMNTTDFNQIIKQNKIDWMQLGHHGSKTSTGADFLQIVNPRLVFISAGVKNDHRFPDNETIAQLQKFGIRFVSSNQLNWSFNLISQRIHAFN